MIKASGYRILIKADDVEMTTESGIVIGTNEKLEKTGVQRGTIVSVGPTAWKAFRDVHEGKEHSGRPWANVGDYVMFARHAGKFVYDPFDEDKEYLIMNDEDIIAVLYDDTDKVEDNE